MQAVSDEYLPQIDALQEGEEKEALLKEYKEKLRLAKNDRIMNKMQMIFQDPIASLNPRMTVREIIAEGLIIRGIKDKNYIDEQVYKVLDLVGLVPEHAGRYPHEFSGGQRQRIGIARAVILQPELIIADEPISALDVSIQAQVINLLNDLRNRLGLTILFIAHDLSVVKYFSDRIAVMYFGKIVELATSDELFAHPLHPYTKSLLSAIPLPDPHYEKKRKRITYNPITTIPSNCPPCAKSNRDTLFPATTRNLSVIWQRCNNNGRNASNRRGNNSRAGRNDASRLRTFVGVETLFDFVGNCNRSCRAYSVGGRRVLG